MNNSIFKPVRISERLKELKEKFDSKCIFNHEEKILTYTGEINIVEYNILLENYKDYLVNVNESVWLHNQNLNSIDIKFSKVKGYFCCSFNNLISLKNCPEEVGRSFYCNHNNLISLKYSPKVIGKDFCCNDNVKQFIKQEILKYCKVGKEIVV